MPVATLLEALIVRIDVISDVVCPWCFIGKRRLARALELFGADGAHDRHIEVIWHPFQLNPDLPPHGMDRREYVKRKFGARSAEVYARVSAAGRSAGLELAFERIARQPNTTAAHQLIALAGEYNRQDEMVEALFRAYFLEGSDLTSAEELGGLARGVGLEPEAIRANLADDAMRQHVLQQDAQARALGVTGVPFFIFGEHIAVSGAQEPEALARALDQAARQSAAEGMA